MERSAATPTPRPRRRWRRLLSGLLVLAALIGVALVGLALRYPYAENFTTFPRVTRTASGVAGDPINLILIGSQAQITQDFRQAGWLVPDPITASTTARIVAASLAHQAYLTAPISPLFAFGRPQDLAFEKPTSDVQNRGHVRLWLTGTDLDGQPVWIGQASYDQGVELSASTLFPTHHIAPAVDLERNATGADLTRTGLITPPTAVAYAPPSVYAQNGGGDFYESDGEALVLNFTTTTVPLRPPAPVVAPLKNALFLGYDALVTHLLWAIASLLAAVLLVLGFTLIPRMRNYRSCMRT